MAKTFGAKAISDAFNAICRTDFDLLAAQKEELFAAFCGDGCVSQETLDGVLNLLDAVSDLGEAMGLYQPDEAEEVSAE